ncbi:hypothetical protein ACWEQC_06805 [Streptomyces shenzhenensis]
MTTEQQEAAEAAEPDAGEPGEPGQMSERTARAILTAVALLVMWAIVAVVPYTAYVAVGVLGTLIWQRTRARWARRGADEETDQAPAPDVTAALRRLVGDDKGVLLTALRDDLKLPDTKVVKQLLDAAGIPWKAVRTREGNGPAVHRDAIPPAAPSPIANAHGSGCCCRSDDNDNTNNSGEGTPREGIRVERTDGELIIRDLYSSDRHGSARA